MGDVLSLVEKAESAIKEDEAEALAQRLLAAKFDFNDFLKQYKMVTGMGSMGSIMKMLPGALSLDMCSISKMIPSSLTSWSSMTGRLACVA